MVSRETTRPETEAVRKKMLRDRKKKNKAYLKMNFSEYQAAAAKTAIYPNAGNNLTYPVLGLCGESGEVAEKIKKALRDDGGKISKEKRQELKKELGDVLWYVAAICRELRLSMLDVAKSNLEKLESRSERDALGGSGDDR